MVSALENPALHWQWRRCWKAYLQTFTNRCFTASIRACDVRCKSLHQCRATVSMRTRRWRRKDCLCGKPCTVAASCGSAVAASSSAVILLSLATSLLTSGVWSGAVALTSAWSDLLCSLFGCASSFWVSSDPSLRQIAALTKGIRVTSQNVSLELPIVPVVHMTWCRIDPQMTNYS